LTNILEAIEAYLESINLTRSQNTARSYQNAMNALVAALEHKNISVSKTNINNFNEDAIIWFALFLKNYSPATEQLYLTAVAGFFEFLAAERLAEPNLPRMRLLLKQRSRKPGQRLPQFPRDEIVIVVEYANNLAALPSQDNAEHLRNLRDRAFIITLADTGLRVHEAVALRRGDIDWNEAKAIILGKGNRQAVVRFSNRSIDSLRAYLNIRRKIDGDSGRPLISLPIFARHDRGAGRKIKPITTATGRNIIAQRVSECLGEKAKGSITPHSFRHYFVTTVLHASTGNLKLAQELARHKNIAVTQRYAHLSDDELDRSYYDIFDQDN
jgi:integrase/recombinase XerC